MLTPVNETLFVGKNLIEFPSLPSTNVYALDVLSKSAPPEGTVISTPDQTAGKGQIGSKWVTEPQKNLTLSVILYPRFLLPQLQFLLNQAICLAVFDFFTKYRIKGVTIKWPNDIYVQNNKITGILIQNVLHGSVFQASVVGIGLNLNQAEFPDNIPNPTSLFLETGKLYDLKEARMELCHSVEKRYLLLRSGQYEAIKNDYLTHLYRYREEALYNTADGGIFTGRITGVTETGRLLIEDDAGIRSFDFKEIEFVRREA